MTVHLRDRYGDWTLDARAARRGAHPKSRVMGRWLLDDRGRPTRPSAGSMRYDREGNPRWESPRGDLKRELKEELRQKGTKLSGRQRKKLRKALARGGDV